MSVHWCGKNEVDGNVITRGHRILGTHFDIKEKGEPGMQEDVGTLRSLVPCGGGSGALGGPRAAPVPPGKVIRHGQAAGPCFAVRGVCPAGHAEALAPTSGVQPR